MIFEAVDDFNHFVVRGKHSELAIMWAFVRVTFATDIRQQAKVKFVYFFYVQNKTKAETQRKFNLYVVYKKKIRPFAANFNQRI